MHNKTNILNLIYTNPAFGTMINFEVEIETSYDEALRQHGAHKYVGALLKEARDVIVQFGKKVDFPSSLAAHTSDEELDYCLTLIETSVDAFIDGHVFVRVPSEHATSLMDRTDAQDVWRVNGVGLGGLLLAKIGKDGVRITITSFLEAQEHYRIISEPTQGESHVSK